MKKIIFTILIYTVLPYVVSADSAINSFDARISVSKNATIEVTERISYDFGNVKRHGIFRYIPYSYQAGSETYTADISSVIVTDGIGQPLPFNESRDSGTLTIKIGNPNKTISGEHVYVISYIVKGPFLYFDEQDEFYWNVTGEWPVPINKASVLVDLPGGAHVISATCYKGTAGSKEKCDNDEKLVNTERAGYNAIANNLNKGEEFTVDVVFPKGTIAVIEKPWKGRSDNYTKYFIYIIPFLAFVVMFYLWYTRGRDPKGRSSIVTQFEPPKNITPIIAGLVYDEVVDGKDIVAEIIQLAISGYIKIHKIEKEALFFTKTDYMFERINNDIPEDEIDALILEKLFQTKFESEEYLNDKKIKGALLSKMKKGFVKDIEKISEKVYGMSVIEKLFPSDPNKIRNKYLYISIAIIIFISFLVVLSDSEFSFATIFTTAIVFNIFVQIMPVKTKRGVEVKEHLEGLRRYIGIAEKDRIEFHNNPEKTPELFEILLPYAIVFGLEEKWVKEFENIYKKESDWYSGAGSFGASSFSSDVSGFVSDFGSAVMPTSSGSGGAGSSGGGFGGGGGGSW